MIESALPEVEVLRIAPVHKLTEADWPEVEAAVRSADIVLSQPIGEAFGLYAVDAMRGVRGGQQWIMFPSLYFGGLLPYLFYLRMTVGTLLGPIGEYHDRRIVAGYLAGRSIAETAASLSQGDDDFCRLHLSNSIAESRRRESLADIKYMDLVEENLQAEPTFNTFNHPANIILWHVVKQFVEIIGLNVAEGARPATNQWLGETIAAIPEDMHRVAGLKYRQDTYQFQKHDFGYLELIEQFFKVYDTTADLAALFSANSSRSPLAPA